MSLNVILGHFGKVKKAGKTYKVLCPVHGDHSPSLDIDEDPDGTVKMICRSCGANGFEVCDFLGIDRTELFPNGNGSSNGERVRYRIEDATRRHRYNDEHGEMLYDVGVFPDGIGKTFRPFLPNGKQGFGGRKVLYRLDELIASGGPVYFVEGEKDADTLVGTGLTATTNPMGGGKLKNCDHSALKGRDVIVIGDNDDTGRKHVADVVERLRGKAASVSVVDLPGLEAKGDITDWINAGHTIDDLQRLIAEAPTQQPEAATFDPGGVIFDVAAIPKALWGNQESVLAAIGEPTLIYAATGIGKTTVAQRVALAAIGIGNPDVLGYPVKQIAGRVLYIAADRPAQAMRSLRRMVTTEDRATLDERWRWERRRRIRITPDRPEVIYEAAIEAEASLVILDSVKDIVPQVSNEDSGGAYNDAVQICVANGVEIIALHHPRKATSEGRSRLDLDSVYGSTWITAGAGSVIAIDGKAGEGVGKLRQLKMPAEEVGPFDIDFDYDAGTVTTLGRRDLLEWITGQGTATTKEATSYQLGKDDPKQAEKRKVRRQLGRYERDGYLTKIEVTGSPTIWRSTATKVLHKGSEIGRSGVGQGVGQGGWSPTRSGSVTETGNVDTARPEGVGHRVGQGRSGGSVTLAPSIGVPMTTPAGTEEEGSSVCPTCRKPLKVILHSGLCRDCDAAQVAP